MPRTISSSFVERASARLRRPWRRRLRITGEVSGGRRWFARRPPPWSGRGAPGSSEPRSRPVRRPVRVAVSLAVRGVAHDRPMNSTAPRVRFADRLDREWTHLSHRREVVARARAWGLTTRPFASLDELVVLAGLTGPRATAAAGAGATVVADDEADELLHRLALCARSDWLAGRIVLQRILGGLLRIAGAEQRREPDVDALSLLVGEAWLAIARYRRPRAGQVAARLLNDARHGAFVGPRRRRGVAEVLTSPSRVAEPRVMSVGLAVRRAGRRAPSRARLWSRRRGAGVGARRARPRHPGRRRAARRHATNGAQPPRSRRRHHPRPRRLTDGRFPFNSERKVAAAARRRQSKSAGRLPRKAAMPSWAAGPTAAVAITSTARR